MSLHKIAYLLVFVGALNWGLVGLFGFNLVNFLFGSMMSIEKLVYILVGLSALWEMKMHMYMCSECSEGMKTKRQK